MNKVVKDNFDSTMVKRGIAAIIVGIILVWFFYFMTPNLKSVGEEYSDDLFCTVSNDGSYIEIDTDPLNFGSHIEEGSEDAIRNINKELGLPESVYAQMVSTRAIDGTQNYENDKFSVSWTYHPDDGLEVIYSVK